MIHLPFPNPATYPPSLRDPDPTTRLGSNLTTGDQPIILFIRLLHRLETPSPSSFQSPRPTIPLRLLQARSEHAQGLFLGIDSNELIVGAFIQHHCLPLSLPKRGKALPPLDDLLHCLSPSFSLHLLLTATISKILVR